MELMDEEERQRWWLSVMQQAVATQSDYGDDSSSILERGRTAARRRDGVSSFGASSPGSPLVSPSALLAERDQLRQSLMDLETKVADLEGSRFEPPELEELQLLCSTLESQKRSLEQELLQLRQAVPAQPAQPVSVVSAIREQSEKIEALEMENSKLQDDLFKQRDDHSRVEAELQLEKGRLRELQEELGLLKAEYEEKLQSLETEKVESPSADVDSARLNFLELQNSKLQDDFIREKRDRSRLEAELEMERGELDELQERFAALQAAYDERSAQPLSQVDVPSAAIDILEHESSKLREDRARLAAELETERGELNQLQERFIQQQLERFQTSDSKAVPALDTSGLEARIQELEAENRRLAQEMQESLADQLATKVLREAEDELKHQASPTSEPSQPSASKAKPPEPAELLAVDSPGMYVVSQTVTLTVGPEKGSARIQNLNAGTVIQILEVIHRLEDRRVRGRVEEPAGWISIVGTEDSNRWAVRDLPRSNGWVCGMAKQIQSLQRELDVLQASTSEAQQAQESVAAEVSRSRQDLATAQAEAAEDLGHREREVHALREKQRQLELQLHQAQLQSDSPGIYVLSGDVDVCADICRHSAKVGRLLGGREVPILEVQHREGDKRVRGRVALSAEGLEGWISLLDMGTGHRWALRQLGATTEWIRELMAGPQGEAPRESPELSSHGVAGALSGDTLELQELRGKVLLMEANREELSLQAELLGTKYGALQAEHEELQQYLVQADSDAARGRSLQALELQRQVNEHVLQRGQLEAELARLRAEIGALTANPVLTAENPLAQAERWVLYTEIPAVEETSSLSYPGHILVNFDDEELTIALGPLAAVNFAQRIGALTALERGDVARGALKAYCREDLQKRGHLDAPGVHSFVRSVFQHHNLTPPMEDHVLTFYRLFSHEADPLDARSCLCLCDALLRAVLRSSGRRAVRPVAVAESQGLGLSREAPEAGQGSAPAAPAAPATPAAPAAPAMKCGFCGEEFEEDSMFCTNCGARRPELVADLVPLSPAGLEPAASSVPLPPQSQGRLGSPSPTSHLMPPRICQACKRLLADDSDFCSMCGQRYVGPAGPSGPAGPQAPRPMVSPKCLDQSRIRTCRPVSAEMGARSLQAPLQQVAPPMSMQSMPVTYVRSQ